MRFDIITIFPHIFESYFGTSIIKRAQEKKIVEIKIHNLRDFAIDARGTVDGRPYGGGAGMVLMAEPILKSLEAILKNTKHEARNPKQIIKSKFQKLKTRIIILSAKGKQFNQKMAYDWSKKYDQLILISGRYEGIDERVKKILKADLSTKALATVEEISIGPYVLTDGEVPAMAIVSAVTRLLPDAIKLESLAEESHWNLLLKKETLRQAQGKKNGLEYPHYTRPEILEYKGKKYKVPPVLL